MDKNTIGKEVNKLSVSDVDVVTLLQDLNAKVDAIQRNQATLRPDIIEHIVRLLAGKWKDEAARRRERTW